MACPDFDDFQRLEFFAMTDAERDLALQRSGLLAQIYCLLQTGYFKAKQAFFRFSLNDVSPEDIAFLLQRYFPGQELTMRSLPAKEYYAQRKKIAGLFEYRLWSDEDLPSVTRSGDALGQSGRHASISFDRAHGISDRSTHRAAWLHYAPNSDWGCPLRRCATTEQRVEDALGDTAHRPATAPGTREHAVRAWQPSSKMPRTFGIR